MNTKSNIFKVLAMTSIVSMSLAQPVAAEAAHNWHRQKQVKGGHNFHYVRQHDGTNPYLTGTLVFPFPKGYVKISVGGKKYHYRDGYFYRKKFNRFEPVPAPIGACLHQLPYGYVKFTVDGVAYYTYNGVYYKHTHRGYEVVERPVVRHAKKHGRTASQRHRSHSGSDEITFSIATKNGSVTVTLEPSGDGYIGPQGEYYDEFPSVDHLRAIYGS